MALANYIKTCGKNVPGVRPQIFVAPAGTITALAETSNEISTLTAAANTFMRIQADVDSVQFTATGAFGTTGAYEQSLITRFSVPSTELNVLVDELTAQIGCGFEIIYIDGNAKVWLTGASISTKEGGARPWNKLETNLDTGVLPTDQDVQADTITFKRMSGVRPVELDSTLTTAVLAGTAAYIKWGA
jgi:hypothetical protein